MKWAYGLFEVLDLEPAERAVLLALCWDHTEAGGCFPSQGRLVLLTGYRERKVRDLLGGLEAKGLIGRKRVRKGGKHAHTQYRLFGSFRREATGRRGPVEKAKSYRHGGAGSDHRQTGAGYRGNIYKGEALPENVIELRVEDEKKRGAV